VELKASLIEFGCELHRKIIVDHLGLSPMDSFTSTHYYLTLPANFSSIFQKKYPNYSKGNYLSASFSLP